jgi:hypothetical protein
VSSATGKKHHSNNKKPHTHKPAAGLKPAGVRQPVTLFSRMIAIGTRRVRFDAVLNYTVNINLTATEPMARANVLVLLGGMVAENRETLVGQDAADFLLAAGDPMARRMQDAVKMATIADATLPVAPGM